MKATLKTTVIFAWGKGTSGERNFIDATQVWLVLMVEKQTELEELQQEL